MGFFSKNEAKEYKEFESFSLFIDELTKKDEFISRKEFAERIKLLENSYKEFVLLKDKNVLRVWCKSNRVDYRKLLLLLEKYSKASYLINKHNSEYVDKHLAIDKEYLDNVLFEDDSKIKLDEEQRRVVLADEDYTLVIAGAGAGKTTIVNLLMKWINNEYKKY